MGVWGRDFWRRGRAAPLPSEPCGQMGREGRFDAKARRARDILRNRTPRERSPQAALRRVRTPIPEASGDGRAARGTVGERMAPARRASVGSRWQFSGAWTNARAAPNICVAAKGAVPPPQVRPDGQRGDERTQQHQHAIHSFWHRRPPLGQRGMSTRTVPKDPPAANQVAKGRVNRSCDKRGGSTSGLALSTTVAATLAEAAVACARPETRYPTSPGRPCCRLHGTRAPSLPDQP